MRSSRGWYAPLGLLWFVLVIGVLGSRPPWPVDETRYLAVAWEMWERGDFLVPYLNGAPYSHKPPLLFWLFHLGWAVFGVNDWWPRVVPPLFALTAVVLTVHLSRRLWPERPATPRLAAWILFGSLLWLVFTPLLMFDMLVVCFALLGVLGLIDAARRRPVRGFALFGAAVGLGLLAKGPVILVYTLPLALAAPWWMGSRRIRLPAWYSGVFLSLGLGIAVALAWALPAAAAGGPAYRAAIFWNQTAGRVAASFAHREPWWWYLPVLPLVLFPWFVWPTFWRGLARSPMDFGMRVVLAWMAPAFVALSLISGKQPHYLLPVFPAFALLAAHGLCAGGAARRLDPFPPALVVAGAGGVWLLMAAGLVPAPAEITLPALPGIVLTSIGLLIVPLARGGLERQVRALALATVLVATTVYAEVVRVLGPSYDVRPLATHLATLERAGTSLAHVGKYHGQYQFFGRLQRPVEVICVRELDDWLRRHPHGRVISYLDRTGGRRDGEASGIETVLRELIPEYVQSFRGGLVVVESRG